jgi:hypothetical protein
MDVAKSVPGTWQLDGFDISAEQYPAKEWLGPNITLSKLDAFAPIPEELLEKYDIIHCRLFVCVVPNGDPTALINNVAKMLSQWMLPLMTDNSVLTSSQSLEAGFNGMRKTLGRLVLYERTH